MSSECTWLISCPFFEKYRDSDNVEIVRLKNSFCKGPYRDQCARKIFRELHAKDAAVDMCPEGKIHSSLA